MILVVIPKLRGARSLNTKNLLKFVVLVQYIPRFLRIYPLYREVTRTSGILTETAWAGAAFNLLLYMLASHVRITSCYSLLYVLYEVLGTLSITSLFSDFPIAFSSSPEQDIWNLTMGFRQLILLSAISGVWSLLVLVLDRTGNYMLAEGLWSSYWLCTLFFVLWLSEQWFQRISQFFLPHTDTKYYTIQLRHIPWCPSAGCCRVDRFSREVILLLLVGLAELKVQAINTHNSLTLWFTESLSRAYCFLVLAALLVKTSRQVRMSGRSVLRYSFPYQAWCYSHSSSEICR